MYKLFIVEDEHLEIEAIELILSQYGKNITVIGKASSGRVALDEIRRLDPDIVLLDINIPEINGIDVLRAIKKEDQEKKVILITAFNEMCIRDSGYTVHFTDELIAKGLSTVSQEFDILRPDGTNYHMGGGSLTMATAGSPPYVMENGEFRFAEMHDYVDICKLVQTSDYIDMTHLLLCDTYDVPRDCLLYTSNPFALQKR